MSGAPTIRVGALLRWWYENMSERNYLLMLRAVRADQEAQAVKRRELAAAGEPDE